MSHVIVLGNEKGGSGKSTVAMHLAIWLTLGDVRVGAIDLDVRQRSFVRYLENRKATADRLGMELVTPEFRTVAQSQNRDREVSHQEDCAAFERVLEELDKDCEFVVIDCPGAQTSLSTAAHGAADILISPINDSFVDFDLLAQVHAGTGKVLGPSIYSESVWDARKSRAKRGRPAMDWIVMRNRIATLGARNQQRIQNSMENLSQRIGFRVVPGFSERVIFRELFLHGLTLLDVQASQSLTRFSLSHVAARQELRDLVQAMRIEVRDTGNESSC